MPHVLKVPALLGSWQRFDDCLILLRTRIVIEAYQSNSDNPSSISLRLALASSAAMVANLGGLSSDRIRAFCWFKKFGAKMIYIDRSRVPMPDVLQASNFGGVERREAERFFSAKTRNQQRFQFRAMRHPEVRRALIDLFFNKCAYCESPLSVVAGDVELYRPKGAVSESPTHLGYWWLAMDWTNLFIACPDCNRVRRHNLTREDAGVSGKGNRFPLLNEASRCFRPLDDITLEQPMLLNPCIDDPDEHLIFDWNGLAASDTLRGQTTIMVLGLNRSSLVDARAREAQMFRFILDHADLDDLDAPSALALTTELKAVATGATAYAGMKRQLLRRARTELNLEGEQDKAPISMARRKRAWRALQHFEQEQSAYTLSNEAGRRIARSSIFRLGTSRDCETLKLR